MVQSESAQWLQENVGGPLHEGIQKAIQASNPKYPAPHCALTIVSDHLHQYVAIQEAAAERAAAAAQAAAEAEKAAVVDAEKKKIQDEKDAAQAKWQDSVDNLAADVKAKYENEGLDKALEELTARFQSLTGSDAAYTGVIGAGEEEEQLSYKYSSGNHANSEVDITKVSVPKSKGVWPRAFPEPDGDEPAAPALVHVPHATDDEGLYNAGGFRLGSFAAAPVAYDSSRSHDALLSASADLKAIEEQFAADTAVYEEAKAAYDENVAAHAESGYEEGEEQPEEPVAPEKNERQPLPTTAVKYIVAADTLKSASKYDSQALAKTHESCQAVAAALAEVENAAIFKAAEYVNNAESRQAAADKLAEAVAAIDAEETDAVTRFGKVCSELLPKIEADVKDYLSNVPVLHDNASAALGAVLAVSGKSVEAEVTGRALWDATSTAFAGGALTIDADAALALPGDIPEFELAEDDVAQGHPALGFAKLLCSAHKDAVQQKKDEAEAAAAAAAEAAAAEADTGEQA